MLSVRCSRRQLSNYSLWQYSPRPNVICPLFNINVFPDRFTLCFVCFLTFYCAADTVGLLVPGLYRVGIRICNSTVTLTISIVGPTQVQTTAWTKHSKQRTCFQLAAVCSGEPRYGRFSNLRRQEHRHRGGPTRRLSVPIWQLKSLNATAETQILAPCCTAQDGTSFGTFLSGSRP